MKPQPLLYCFLFLQLTLVSLAEPAITKLYASKIGTPSGFAGMAVAVNDQWIVIGEPGYGDPVANAGSVTVLSAANGAVVRRIQPDDVTEGRLFGMSLALDGNTLVVGAAFDSEGAAGAGAAYVFDVRTGKQLRKLLPGDPGVFELFGVSVAASEGLIVVGCRDDTVFNDAGAAYVFDAKTGAQLHKLTASDAAANREFGSALDMSGKMVIVGATNAPGAVAGCGAAYVFDAESGVETIKLIAAGAVAAGDNFGDSVSIQGHLAMVGAPGNSLLANDAGAVYFFDIVTGNQLFRVVNTLHGGQDDRFGDRVLLREGFALVGASDQDDVGALYQIDLRNGTLMPRIRAADGDADDMFSGSMAVSGGTIVLGAPGRDELASNAGCAYWLRPMQQTLPVYSLTKIGDSAPDLVGTKMTSFTTMCINSEADVAMRARTSKGQGSWSSLGLTDSLQLGLHSGDSVDAFGAAFAGLKVRSVSTHSILQQQLGVMTVLLSNGKQAVLRDNAVSLMPVLLVGQPVPLLGGAAVRTIHTVLQNRDFGNPRLAIPYLLQRQAGVTTADKDSGILFADNAAGILIDAQAREGTAAPGGGVFGQFSARAALGTTRVACAVPRIAGSTTTHMLFTRVALGISDTAAEQGDVAPGAGGAVFRRFLAETVSMTGQISFRASLSGAGVNALNNEGLWQPGIGLVARKNSQVPGEAAGVKWRRFLGFWPVADHGLVIHAATSAGTGVWVKQEDGSLFKLFHTGGDRRAILRVDVDPDKGSYAILASMRGKASRNQVLFAGSLAVGVPDSSLRLPKLRMRKGPFLKSMAFPKVTDASGSGGKGLSQIINDSANIVLLCRRTAATQELVLSKEVDFNP